MLMGSILWLVMEFAKSAQLGTDATKNICNHFNARQASTLMLAQWSAQFVHPATTASMQQLHPQSARKVSGPHKAPTNAMSVPQATFVTTQLAMMIVLPR